MLKLGNRIFIKDVFKTEDEIEAVVIENADYIFGPSSIFLPKMLIKTIDGFGTIPDGFAVDLATKQWFIVEAELAKHNVWSHIAPQVAKQITASKGLNTRRSIANLVVEKVKNDKEMMEKFSAEGIATIHIHQVVSDILVKPPIVGMPIDEISVDLKDWASTFKVEVKLWEINKYTEFGNPECVLYQFPEEYKPAFDTAEDQQGNGPVSLQYDVNLKDLLDAGLLQVGQALFMSYKPERKTRQDYQAVILEGGSLSVMENTFTSPSYAALHCIQNAGSPRKTTNGWTSWKDASGNTLAKLREQYLKTKS